MATSVKGMGLVFIVAGLLMPLNGHALSLEEATATALENRPAIRLAHAQSEQALAGYAGARAAAMPKLDLTVSATRMDDPAQALFAKLSQQRMTPADLTIPGLNDPGGITDLSAGLRLTQPLYAGGRILAGVRGAQAGAEAARASLVETEAETRAAVTRAYYGQILAREGYKVVQGAEATAIANLELARNRFEAGSAVRADLLAAQAHVARVKGEVIGAGRDLALARTALVATLGVDDLPSEPTAALPVKAASVADLATLLERARQSRPMLKAAAANVRRAEERLKIARGAYLPEVGLSASAADHRETLTGDNGTVWQAGVMASWRLVDGGDRSSGRALAEAELQHALAAYEKAWAAARTQVTAAYMSRQAAQERIRAAKLEVAASREGLQLTRDRYEAGAALFTELQEAEDGLARARLTELSARHDLAVEEAALIWAVGDSISGG